MIITEQKPLEEVLSFLKGSKKILVLGCGRCATSCQTGGEKQVQQMREVLEDKGLKVAAGMVEAQCDERLSKRELKAHSGYDCILSMSCGSGAAALTDLTDKSVYPTNNTLFLGVIKPGQVYEERCSLCGECLLGVTGGICPLTRCSKGLLHGPCGGSSEGACEVDPLRDCAWSLITERLRKLDKSDDLRRVHAARSNLVRSRPRSVGKK